jgi:hypothetical protein
MQRGTQVTPKHKKPLRQVRFPGLMTAAHTLGVHRNHLYQVLAGKRTSHSLTRRYNAWKEAHNQLEAA